MCTKVCKHEGCDNEVRNQEGRNHNQCGTCANNLSRYGITTPQRDALAEEQGWNCKVCKTPITFNGHKGRDAAVVDHCHTRGHIRGILCTQCNKALGLFNDDAEAMRRAANYLDSDDVKFFDNL